MSESNKDENINKEDNKLSSKKESNQQNDEISIEKKLKNSEEKLLRSLADSENQRRRFEKEIKDAFEFGGFNFAKEMLITLDNLQRAKKAMQEDEVLKKSKEFEKFLKNIEIIEKDLVTTFEKNKINKINCLNETFDPNFHQAMLEIEDDKVEPGTIVQEIQTGFHVWRKIIKTVFCGNFKRKKVKKTKKINKNALQNNI